jgi:serine/threonine-protein kinase RsbT
VVSTLTVERIELPVSSQFHVERIRREARRLSLDVGFDAADVERVVLATIELATNLVRYGRNGRMILEQVHDSARSGIQIESHDDGPGIAQVATAMMDGVSTRGGFGDGLPSVRRLLDDFEIDSDTRGTNIVGRRWLKPG